MALLEVTGDLVSLSSLGGLDFLIARSRTPRSLGDRWDERSLGGIELKGDKGVTRCFDVRDKRLGEYFMNGGSWNRIDVGARDAEWKRDLALMRRNAAFC